MYDVPTDKLVMAATVVVMAPPIFFQNLIRINVSVPDCDQTEKYYNHSCAGHEHGHSVSLLSCCPQEIWHRCKTVGIRTDTEIK